jgi:hypothetical protein
MLIQKHLDNNKGMAALEVIPITIIVVLILSFSYGFFGVIHTGILNSMGARNYAFETFNHRVDLRYLRTSTPGTTKNYLYKYKFRVHGILSDRNPTVASNNSDVDIAMATARPISFIWNIGTPETLAPTDTGYHTKDIFTIQDDGTRYNAKDGVNPVWIQTSYGICLSRQCTP